MDAMHEANVRARALQAVLAACDRRPGLLDPALVASCARLAGRLALWASIAEEHREAV